MNIFLAIFNDFYISNWAPNKWTQLNHYSHIS